MTKYYKDALYIAAEHSYKDEIVDTDMVEHTIGEKMDFASREEWIVSRVNEWLEEADIRRSKLKS